MQSEKQSHRAYTSIDTLPVWNWYKISGTNDLRYLLILPHYDTLPDFEEIKINLIAIYDSILEQLPHVNTHIQYLFVEAKKAALEAMFYIESDNKDRYLQKAHRTFSRYKQQLNGMFTGFKYGDKEYKTADDCYTQFRDDWTKSNLGLTELLNGRLNLFDYRNLKAKQLGKMDLLDEVVRIRDVVNQDIDIYKCSLAFYLKIKEFAMERQRAMKKKLQKYNAQ